MVVAEPPILECLQSESRLSDSEFTEYSASIFLTGSSLDAYLSESDLIAGLYD